MFARVRRYSQKDKDEIRKICLDNAPAEDKTDKNGLAYYLLTQCECYLDHEPDTCYVAVDENDSVIGYALCAPDYDGFAEYYESVCVPAALDLGPRRYVDAKMNLINFSMFRSMYPAHFYLNVSGDCRGQGVEEKILDIMKRDLCARGAKKMMLVCGDSDADAKAFYESHGFRKLLATKLGALYAADFGKAESDEG